MRSETAFALTAAVAVLVVTAAVGSYLALTPAVTPSWLPVPAGTTFTENESVDWVVHVTVGPSAGTLVGTWTAYHGFGVVTLAVVNGTVSKPPGLAFCPHIVSGWTQQNGTVNLALPPGPHTVYWTTGYCASAQRILVTRSIAVLPA